MKKNELKPEFLTRDEVLPELEKIIKELYCSGLVYLLNCARGLLKGQERQEGKKGN